jgi:VanZ family protein
VHRALRWTPAVLWMALIFYSSSQPDPAPVLTRNIWDKGLHFSGYAVLAICYAWALSVERMRPRVLALIVIGCASVFAASDEVHQMFTPGRSPDALDWVADTVGGGLGALAFLIVKRQ